MFNHYADNVTYAVRGLEITAGPKHSVKDVLSIEAAYDRITCAIAAGGRIFLFGNGGSSSIASHIAVDLNKNEIAPALAFSDSVALTCSGNDYGFEEVFAKQIEWHADENDVVFAISSSGCSGNILEGVSAAIDRGCYVVTLSGMDWSNPLRFRGHCNFWVPSMTYGIVESSHLIILHSLADRMAQEQRDTCGNL